jgi:hypothetical protein
MHGVTVKKEKYIIIAPTCFGALAPSSGNLYVVLAKVIIYENTKIKYS